MKNFIKVWCFYGAGFVCGLVITYQRHHPSYFNWWLLIMFWLGIVLGTESRPIAEAPQPPESPDTAITKWRLAIIVGTVTLVLAFLNLVGSKIQMELDNMRGTDLWGQWK